MDRFTRKEAGFTLVELGVIIVIVSMLAVFAVPALWWTFTTVAFLEGTWLRDSLPALWAVGVVLFVGKVAAEDRDRSRATAASQSSVHPRGA